MTSCLGIYVGENIIKYAKVNKEKDNLKIEAFGVKFYKNSKETIDQIVAETFSNNVPISVNTSNETYDYFYMSNLLNKKDLQKAASTEFESLCYERKVNANALETRYAFVSDVNDKERIKVIHVSTDKISINKTLLDFSGHSISNMSPISLSIPTIAPIKVKENIAIINMDDVATVTILTGEKIFDVQRLSVGAKDVIEKIRENVNSYTKAYEICKNTTIYTMEEQSNTQEGNNYLQNIIPTLYTIATRTKEILNTQLFKINKVYLTGTLTVVNNIELYFEEILNGVKCEILKPFFAEENPSNNIKDYIEVNSAIALGMQGLGYGLGDINFHKKEFFKKFGQLLTTDVSVGGKGKKKGARPAININIDTKKMKTWVTRDLTFAAILAILYVGITTYINNATLSKEKEIADVTSDINKQISMIESDKKKIDEKKSEYDTLVTNLQNASDTVSASQTYKKVIPVLLSEIMNVIPKGVQLTSIENTSEKKIVINAQSSKYEQLAIFKTVLKSEGILEPSSVVSSEAVKEGDIVKIVIEGVLP